MMDERDDLEILNEITKAREEEVDPVKDKELSAEYTRRQEADDLTEIKRHILE